MRLQTVPYNLPDLAVIPNRSIYLACGSKVGFLLVCSRETSSSSSSGGGGVAGRGLGGGGGRGCRGRGGTKCTVSSEIL